MEAWVSARPGNEPSARSPIDPDMRVHREVAHVMGMPISVALRGRHTDDDRAARAWARVMRVLTAADRMFSTYRVDSLISRLNRGDLDLRECPAEVHEVVQLGERAREDSRGAFNIRRGDGGGRLVLDPSGVVKGWAIERAARELDALPATDFCLSGGGDMVCRSKVATMPAWRIGIEDPANPRRIIATVPIRNGAVATSGLTHRGPHIVDARTGQTPTELASVTVIARHLVDADIDATAAFALGAQAPEWLGGRAGRRGMLVWVDGATEFFD
jgi:thiamine biosynthesis lipoprotein